MVELGLDRHPPAQLDDAELAKFEYRSLEDSEHRYRTASTDTSWAASIYRGIVPAENILHRDFAINGGTVGAVCADR